MTIIKRELSGFTIDKSGFISELKLLSSKMVGFIKRRPLFAVFAALNLVAAYGFFATHYTFNLDQLVSESYNGTVLISAGRWSAPLIHMFSNWMEYAPFWHTLAMMFLLYLSGLVFVVLFEDAANGQLKDSALFVFWLIFPTFPMISEQLTYPILNIALAYLLVPVVLWLLRKTIFDKTIQFSSIVIALVFLIVSIDMYESFAAVFLVGICGIALLRSLFAPNNDTVSQSSVIHDCVGLFFVLLRAVLVLLVVIAADFCLSKMVCLISTGSFDFWYNSNTSTSWFARGGLLDSLVWLFREALAHYVLLGAGDLAVFLFDASVIIGGIVLIVLSVKRRSIFPILIYCFLLLAVISLCIVEGAAPLYRTEQTIPIFVGFVFLLLYQFLSSKRLIKYFVVVVFTVIVFNQTQTINRYSIQNYERYMYEVDLMRDIGESLRQYDTHNKPVAFVQNSEAQILPKVFSVPHKTEHPVLKKYRQIMCSFWDWLLPQKYYDNMDAIIWSHSDIAITDCDSLIQSIKSKTIIYVPFLQTGESDLYVIDLYRGFSRLGYDLKVCYPNMFEQAKNLIVEEDPSVRYKITENESVIVVQLMSAN